mmetsp:Transcript_9664/g.14044  ORF Transcript_9664/g.14044 Transcript_9664/m.14044 type:complete len:241 (+) Transcript_9664:104-826(+)
MTSLAPQQQPHWSSLRNINNHNHNKRSLRRIILMGAIVICSAAAAVMSFIVAMKILPTSILLPGQQHTRLEGCEGYYPDIDICLALGTSKPSRFQRTRANAACPQWRMNSNWGGKNEFSTKLKSIEDVAKEWEKVVAEMDEQQSIDNTKCNMSPSVWIRRERGVAWSRIEEGVMAGNSEYHVGRQEDDKHHICWTDVFRPMYVDTYGVEPSDEFQAFVASFDIDLFSKELEVLKDNCRIN